MHVRKITLHLVQMRLKTPFAASNGVYTDRKTILVEMENDSGIVGWGECVAFETPWYTEETVETCWHMMRDFLIPAVFHQPFTQPSFLHDRFSFVKGNRMAKAGLETAAWDLFSKEAGLPLSQVLGGVRKAVEAGVAVGLQPSESELFRTVDTYVSEGYQRIKVKIKPGMDVDLIRSLRSRFRDIPLMADANSAYSLNDLEHLKRLDPHGLLMLEQPLAADDIVDHAKLARCMSTPICLDESIVSAEDARKAIELGSCKVINIKIGRVGGLLEAKRIHDVCAERGVPVWCGGMLETGVGRAHNIALASLTNFSIPGDISASDRYWERDVIQPEVTVADGMIPVPEKPGIGFEIDKEFVQSITIHKQVFYPDH